MPLIMEKMYIYVYNKCMLIVQNNDIYPVLVEDVSVWIKVAVPHPTLTSNCFLMAILQHKVITLCFNLVFQ